MPFHQPRRHDHPWSYESCLAHGCKSCCGCVEAQGQCSGCEAFNAFNSVTDVIQLDWQELEAEDWTNEADEWDVIDGKKFLLNKNTKTATIKMPTNTETKAAMSANKMPTNTGTKAVMSANQTVLRTATENVRVGARNGRHDNDSMLTFVDSNTHRVTASTGAVRQRSETKQVENMQGWMEMGHGKRTKESRPVFLLYGEDEE